MGGVAEGEGEVVGAEGEGREDIDRDYRWKMTASLGFMSKAV